jgi:hypothetical protein
MGYFNLAVVVFAVDLLRYFLGLFAIPADDGEFVLALLAVPDGVLPAEIHRYADLAGIGWDFDGGQGDDP